MKQLKWTAAAIAMIAATMALSGCSTSGLVGGDSEGADSPYFIVDDHTFGRQVKIVKVGHDFKGDLMRGYATLQSRRHRSLQIQYRFSWYDEAGVEIDSGTRPYNDVVIEGKDAVTVSSMAPNASAKEFKIRVKKLKVIKIENLR